MPLSPGQLPECWGRGRGGLLGKEAVRGGAGEGEEGGGKLS